MLENVAQLCDHMGWKNCALLLRQRCSLCHGRLEQKFLWRDLERFEIRCVSQGTVYFTLLYRDVPKLHRGGQSLHLSLYPNAPIPNIKCLNRLTELALKRSWAVHSNAPQVQRRSSEKAPQTDSTNETFPRVLVLTIQSNGVFVRQFGQRLWN